MATLAIVGAILFGMSAAGVLTTLPGVFSYLVSGQTSLDYDLSHASASTTSALFQEINLGNVSATPVFTPPAKGKVIRVDLSAMKLSLYENGNVKSVIDILSRGRPGTPWETPAGDYTILTKEEKHYSSIGEVWMPWSLQFFGNFFIHGWPYDSQGKAVLPGYSGGCVRLSTPAAKEVYAFADINTAVSVYGPSSTTPGYAPHYSAKSFYLLNRPQPLTLSTKSYLVADLETGEVIIEKDMHRVVPIASVSKLMTALVSLEVLNQEKVTTVSKRAAAMTGTTGKLQTGEKIKIGELLYPLLLESGNDAAEAIAEAYGRDQFIKMMNTKSGAIGLNQTYFVEPTGLSADNISTAYDLAKLAHYLNVYKQHLFDITKMPSYQGKNHLWFSKNGFKDSEVDYLGGKIGFTDEAKQTQVAIFSVPFAGGLDRPIVVVLLQSENRRGDLTKIVNYLKRYVFYGEQPVI